MARAKFVGQDALDKLAVKHIGDPKSDLVFVTDDAGTVAVFVGRSLLPDAKALANQMRDPCWVETRDGVFYDNAASERRQREEDD